MVYFARNPPGIEVISWQQNHPWTYWYPRDTSGSILARVPRRPSRPRRAWWPRRPGWSSLSLISLLGVKINMFPALLMWYCWVCWKPSSHRIMKTERQNDGWLWAASIHNMEEEGFFVLWLQNRELIYYGQSNETKRMHPEWTLWVALSTDLQ